MARLTFVLGPNGAGKTAVLVALSRLFSPTQSLRRVQVSDFHAPAGDALEADNELWIEVDIEFPEAADDDELHASIPPFFTHMAMQTPIGPPTVRVRLTATLDIDGYVEERIEYITQLDADGEPTQRSDVSRHDRAAIEVHYLPARRDPSDQIAYTTVSLLGRLLRAADWTNERTELVRLADELSREMVGNAAVAGIGSEIHGAWAALHRGTFYKDPSIAFGRGELDGVLRQLTLTFTPGPGGGVVDFERLSDGQKSLLYISLVLAWQAISSKVLDGSETAFDHDRLRPPVHIILALEEPENSLAPQYLGRIVRRLRDACDTEEVQVVIATHAPSLLKRAEPADIRFLRLDANRTTTVRTILMPEETSVAAKYVREAVQAYPELYFGRLVVLGEGDSEQIVLPRMLSAAGIAEDDISVCVVPLGGRHVHHFWRLLQQLDIPYVTLLDLDAGRYLGGWGRVKYAADRINEFRPGTVPKAGIDALPAWDEDCDFPAHGDGEGWIEAFEKRGVFFSHPLDLDLMMLEAYPDAYEVTPATPSESTERAVLGKRRVNVDYYETDQLDLFNDYQKQFKLGSKPASHLAAMAALDDDVLLAALPGPLDRLIDAVEQRLESIPE